MTLPDATRFDSVSAQMLHSSHSYSVHILLTTMQHAGRLVPPLTRSFRSTLVRPVVPHAGPSSIPRRSISTSPIHRATPAPFSALKRESPDSAVLRSDEVDWQTRMDTVLKYDPPTFHRPPRPGQPILLPLSSLASPTPLKPADSNLAVALAPEFFNARIRRDILHQCVVWFLACKRAGTKKTKGRGEVSFSGRKLRPQKKTGRARLGDAGSPMLRKGGVAHPHRPRDWSYNLQRKVRAAGLRMALSSKLHTGTLRVVNNLNEGQWTKTKQAARALTTGYKWVPRPGYVAPEQQVEAAEEGASEKEETAVAALPEGEYESGKWVWSEGFGESKDLSVLFLHGPQKPAQEIWDFALPLRNIPNVEIMSTDEVQVYHILKYRWLVMEPSAIDAIMRQKGQVSVEQEDLVQDHGRVEAEAGVEAGYTGIGASLPRLYVLNKWRKSRGRKSLQRTLGLKFANEYQLQAKRAWKGIRRSGIRATPDLVALEINKRKSVW